ncbi:MAG TPA: YHS domain-containing protein [Candidatus Tectomicrobia bacterium]|nr:YHS domain-containing protein [Candidatus Tectomicrobia bacterium]
MREVRAMATDPVCGMEVREQQAAGQAQHQGRTYYFCSTDCQRQFQNDPERYARQTA